MYNGPVRAWPYLFVEEKSELVEIITRNTPLLTIFALGFTSGKSVKPGSGMKNLNQRENDSKSFRILQQQSLRMRERSKKKTRLGFSYFLSQIGIWIAMIMVPATISFFMTFNVVKSGDVLWATLASIGPLMLTYFLNFYWLVPRFMFKHKMALFFFFNLLLFIVLYSHMFFFDANQIPSEYRWGIYFALVFVCFIFILDVGFAAGARFRIRWREMEEELKEEKQKNTEAELAWLKNQLNPHFLFNTLNNISSLVQIDADTAQDSISKLSDLLRYTLYESNKLTVPLKGEVDFMLNYIDLMKLRCNEMTTVTVELEPSDKPVEIVPLLFISLIENAFKHGVSAREESFIHISLHVNGNDIWFVCDNSNYPKNDKNRSGSGVGLENLQRRLDLLYPKQYTYIHELNEHTYHVELVLKDCLPKEIKNENT